MQKWIGVICLLIEVNLIGGNIFGFSALYSVLEDHEIFAMNCNQTIATNSTSVKTTSCDSQTHEYEVHHEHSIYLFIKATVSF